jgi:GPH family glycoside/pentoside/hexuronide:cation symporter
MQAATAGEITPSRLSRRTKLSYGVGDVGLSLTSTILGAYFAIFLTDVVGITPGIAAAAIFIGRSWDYINDPIIGHISDRTRSRWGRRRPFILFGSLPFALAFMLLWWRPPIESHVILAIYYALAYIVFDAAATFVYMPYFALTPDLTADYDERTALTTYRMFFSILASLIAFTVPLAIVGGFTPDHASRVMTMGVMFGVISMLPMLLVFAGTREPKAYQALAQPGLRESLTAALRNRPFVFSVGLFLLTWVSVDILQSTLLYFIKYIVGFESQSDVIMGTIFITAILALPLWAWASRKWSKQRAYVMGIAFWAGVQLVLVTLHAGVAFQTVLILGVLAGIGVGAAHVLPWSILPDAVEWDEWQTGERHEGMFYSLVTLMQKVASSIALPLVLLVLQVTGYASNAAVQPASAQLGIRIVVGPIPAVLLCLGIVFALFYPLSRERHAEIRGELEARRRSQAEP